MLLWPPRALQAQTDQLVYDELDADRVVALWGIIPAGETVWAETANLSAGADTVLHVWDFYDGGVELAFNDDMAPGNLASRVELTNTNSEPLSVIVVMRARTAETAGTADLLASGGFHVQDMPVEGTRFAVPCNAAKPYILETALQPNGAGDTVLMAFKQGEQSLHGLDLDFGVGKASRIEGRTEACEVIVGVPWNDRNGPFPTTTTLYVNDWWTDEDGDGLGFELEKALGTCDRRSRPAPTPAQVGREPAPQGHVHPARLGWHPMGEQPDDAPEATGCRRVLRGRPLLRDHE